MYRRKIIMTTDDKAVRMNSVDENNDAIKEAVRVVALDEILDEVEREVNRIATLRSLAQQIMNEMIRNATQRNRDHGSGDIWQRRASLPRETVQPYTTYGQNNAITQGLMTRNIDDHDVNERIKQAINRSRSLSSLVLPTTSHHDYITEFNDLRRASSMPSAIQLRSLRSSKEDIVSVSGQVGNSDSKSCDVQNELTPAEVNPFPRYEEVNTLSTPYGEIKVYANGELDDAERLRILHESVKILKARELADSEKADNVKNEKKEAKEDRGTERSGFVTRMKKFFGRLCCYCCRTSE